MIIDKEKLKIGFIIILVSVSLTVILNFFSGYKNQLRDYLLNNIKIYGDNTIYNREEKVLSLYYLEYINPQNRDKVKEYVNRYYKDLDINNIHDPLIRQFLLECRDE